MGRVKVSVNKGCKKWWKSKTIWFNVITTIIGVAGLLEGLVSGEAIALVVGAGNVVLRTWMTNTQIE